MRPRCNVRRNRSGGIYGLEVVDGATIKRVLDADGRTPMAPDPAYQQILKGLPAVDYSRDELLYRPRNPRPHKIYGYSPVEQILMTVNIALRRQVTQLNYYTEGNTPEALIGVPATWQPDQIDQFQRYWDSLLEGNLAARRHAKFVPGGLTYQPTREPTLKDDMDEWLARVVCFAFSIAPTPFIKQNNRATAESSYDSALQEGLAPLLRWVKNLVDSVILQFWGYTDLEFAWADDTSIDPLEQAQINQIYLSAGVKSADEVRVELGLEEDGPAAVGKAGCGCGDKNKAVKDYNPDQPRDDHGRWVDEDNPAPYDTTGTGPDVVAQVPELVMPGEMVDPIPQFAPVPGSPTDVMPLTTPNEQAPDNSSSRSKECDAEWAAAEDKCDRLMEQGMINRKNGGRGFGRDYNECLKGYVSEACGGSQMWS